MMSDVIRFPQLTKSSILTVSGLTDADENTVSFKMSDLYAAPMKDVTADGKYAEAVTTISFLQQYSSLPASLTGWGNQELADLYRIQRILALAGITTQIDHGLTDEGDPWFVFMDSQNEVFVHFSRFDGLYMVTSQMQEEPIRGDSLQDLVSEFSKRVKPVTEAGRSGQNVVSIAERSRDVVLIHPAAALAALVWSIYLMSDDLIAATPMLVAGETENTKTAADLQKLASDLNVLPEVAQKTLEVLSDPVIAKQAIDPYLNRESLGATGLSGNSAKVIGLGLSIVALTVGLPIPTKVSDAIDDSSSRLSVENLHTLLTQTRAKEAALLMKIEVDKAQQQQIYLIDQVNDEASAKTLIEVDTEALNIALITELATAMETIKASYIVEVESFSRVKLESSPNVRPYNEAQVQTESVAALTEDGTSSQTSGGTSSGSIDETSFLHSFEATFESFKVTNLDRLAQNELTRLLSADNMLKTPNPLAPVDNTHKFNAFDQEARMFLDFLLHTYSDIKVISLATEIIFIHMDAFEAPGRDQPVYAKSWNFDDGGVISAIGLKSDMALFDLVA